MAGIIAVDYYLLKRHRAELDATHAEGKLLETCGLLNPGTLVLWIVAALIGLMTSSLGPLGADIGIPAFNSLVASAVLYWVGMNMYPKAQGNDVARFRQVKYLD